MNKLYIIIFATLIAILPIYFIKKYIITKNKLFIGLALSCYVLLMLSYIKLFSTENIATSYTILQILQIVLVLIISRILFYEKLTTTKYLGIMLGSMSIYLLL